MKLSLMQPYFLPYLGYFDLITSCDLFINYDSVQFIKQGWINRNRILHPHSGWQYITVPLKKESFQNSYRTKIEKIEVSDNEEWKERILRQLEHYKRSAPYYHETLDITRSCLSTSSKFISKINIHALEIICSVLQIEFSYTNISDLDLDLDPNSSAESRVIEICHAVGADSYVNLSGGRELYDPEHFEKEGIKLEFRSYSPYEYDCPGYTFNPNLSVVDVLMWNTPESILEQLGFNNEPA